MHKIPLLSLAAFLSLAPLSFADTAKCRIKAAKPGSAFIPFVGGKAVMELETGQLTVYSASDTLVLAGAERVSSFGAARAGCSYAWEKIVNGDELRALLFKFNNCVHADPADPALRGYVRADFGFDLSDCGGHYREILLTPTGTPPTAHMTFEDCQVVRDAR